MSSSRSFFRTGRDRPKARSKPPTQTSPAQPPSESSAHVPGGTPSTSIPISSSVPLVHPPVSGDPPVAVTAAEGPGAPTGSFAGVVQHAHNIANTLLPFGAAAAEAFPPAKAAIVGVMEILKLVDVSIYSLHSTCSYLSAHCRFN